MGDDFVLDGTVTTVGVGNTAPALTTPATATTNEDAVFAFTGANTVSVTDPNAGDTLTVTLAATNGTLTATGGGVSGSGTATVTVTGTESVVNTALATLSFAPALNFNGSASITVNATDGTAGAIPATIAVTVTAVNDEPSATFSPATVTVNEDSGAFTQTGFATLAPGGGTDENGQTATYAVSNITNASLFDAQPTISPTGTLTFTPAANAFGTATVTVVVTDSGSTDNGGDNTSQNLTFTIVVSAVNDAPTLAGANPVAAVDEDATTNPGTLVSALVAGQITDPDGVGPGIAITATDTANGAWEYALDGTTWVSVGAVSNTSALLLAADATTRVRFVPNANFNGTVSNGLTFRAWDRTTGTAGGSADTSGAGGASAFSAATAGAGVTVNSVNDAPTGADKTVTIDEDVAFTFAASDFGFADADGHALLAVVIASTPAAGTLALGGAPVAAGQVIPVASLGALTFTPAPNASGIGYASFTFQVRDDGGIDNGGADTDPSPNAITVNVNAVNDAPTLNSLSNVSGTIGVPQAVSLSGITAGGGETQGLTVTALSGATAVVANPTVTYSSPSATGSLAFTPVGSGSATITVRVTDDNGTPGDTSDDRFFEQTFTLTVNNLTPVNTFPTDVSTDEDTPLAFTGANAIGIDDPDDTVGGVTTVVSIPVGSGTLSSGGMSGSTLTFTGSEASVNAALAALVYTPPADANVTTLDGSVSLTIRTTDAGNATADDVVRITVNAVNDPPSFALTGDPAAVLEDAGAQSVANFATAVSRGPADEAAQALAFVVTGNSNPALFGAGPAISATGTLTYTPAANASGTATITVVLTDGGGGSDSSAARTFTITVNAVSDAPAGTSATVAVTEDGSRAFTAADFGFTDPLDAPADALAGVVVTTLPGAGALTLGGAPVTAGQFVPVASLGDLVFTPAADGAGTAYASFTFQVRDTGSTTAGGAVTDPTPNAITFDVTGVNDEPTLELTAEAILVQGGAPFAQSGFTIFAPGGGADEAGQAPNYAVTAANPALFSVQPAIDASGRLTFTPAAGASGTTTVTVTAFDGGADGGANDAFSPARTFAVTVNPAPTQSGSELNTSAPPAAAGAQLIAVGSTAGTPGRVLLVNAQTGAVVRDFFPFGGFSGGLRVAVADLTGDGVDDLVVASASQIALVAVFDGATGGLVNVFLPFGPFLSGVQVATGDLNGDGRADLVVGLDSGAPLIVALDGVTGGLIRVFGGLPGADGGTNMAVGDFTGDGRADVATVAGPGGNGLVIVYDGATGGIASAFFAAPGFPGDINLAMGDVDGDGLSELVAGIQVGGTTVVGAFGRSGQLAKVFAVPTGAGTPLRAGPALVAPAAGIAVADLDGDGFADVLLTNPPGTGFSQTVALSGRTGALIRTSVDPLFGSGASVGAR